MLASVLLSPLSKVVSEASPKGLVDNMLDAWIGPIFLAVVCIVAINLIRHQRWSQLILSMMMAGSVGSLLIFFPTILSSTSKKKPLSGGSTSTASPSASASPTPSATATPSPSASPTGRESHFTVNWGQVAFGLFIALAVIALLGLLFFIIFALLPKWRASGEEERKRAAAAAEKRRADELAWVELQSQGHALIDRFMSYRTDMNKLLTHPLMISLEDPLTQRATLTMDQCRNQLDGPLPPLGEHETVWSTACGKAVAEFKAALDAAVANSELKKDKQLSPEAKKAFKRARLLWALAEDPAASDEERATAYERVREELKEHVHLPQETTQVLVAGAQRKAITAAPPASEPSSPTVTGSSPTTVSLEKTGA